MLWIFAFVTVVGLVYGQEGTDNSLPDPTEWDCSNDHAPHGTDPRKFLQSANGFNENSNIFEATCPTQLQVFSQVNGVCRCFYTDALNDLLAQECQIRVPNNVPSDVYELLVPNKNVQTIEELFTRQSCMTILPGYVRDAYNQAGVVPLFFNQTGCRCDWVPGIIRSDIESGLLPPASLNECERLIDQNFTSTAVSSDEVGNYVQLFPHTFQNNVSLSRGGSAFGQGMSEAIWNLPAIDFTDINLVLRFEAEATGQFQCIATNMCRDRGEGGMFDLQFNPSNREYTLQFFSDRVARCSVPSASGQQIVQIRYTVADGVSLLVNNAACDVSSLNPVPFDNESGRLSFDSRCPLQVGGQVFTDPLIADFGMPTNNVPNLSGVFYRVLLLRNCYNPPQMVSDRIAGNV